MSPARLWAFRLSLLLLACFILTGCPGAVKPETPLQTVYVAKESLAVYGTWIVQQHDNGSLSGERYKRAVGLFNGGRKSLAAAHHAAVQNDTDAFVVAMTAANEALAELAKYKGGEQ